MARNRWSPLLPILFALLYGASPVDVIPDVLLLVGWVDDGVMGAAMGVLSLWLLFRSSRRPQTAKQGPLGVRGRAASFSWLPPAQPALSMPQDAPSNAPR